MALLVQAHRVQYKFPSRIISALAGTSEVIGKAFNDFCFITSQCNPAKAYSDNVSGTAGVTAPKIVAGSAPNATETENVLLGVFDCSFLEI